MWKLFNKWFGWHYVRMHWGTREEVFRLRNAPNNRKYVSAYGSVVFIGEDLVSDEGRKVIPLTWTPPPEPPMQQVKLVSVHIPCADWGEAEAVLNALTKLGYEGVHIVS